MSVGEEPAAEELLGSGPLFGEASDPPDTFLTGAAPSLDLVAEPRAQYAPESGLDPGRPSGPGAQGGDVAVYSVGQAAGYIRELLETDPFLNDIWLSGEVTNYSRSQAGHIYFTLADAEGSLRCVFFRQHNLGVSAEQGDSVLVHGRVSIYRERGELQLYVDALQPEGVGVLQAEFQRLLEQLKAEGLFEPARKRPLPRYPRTVGVVTSAAGAVWHDIQTVMGRRWPMAGLLLSPAQVQGDGAAPAIVEAIKNLNEVAAEFDDAEIDVIIVGRGGGSAEDLWAFNDERVARAIYSSSIPIVSAVGHETDYTIADYVADVRAATPSAAAELVVPDQADERARIQALKSAGGQRLATLVGEAKAGLALLGERLQRRAPDLDRERLRLDGLLHELEAMLSHRLQLDRASLQAAQARLEALDPRATLSRGYAIVQDAQGRVVDGAAKLSSGDAITIQFHDGVAEAGVSRVERER